MNTSKAYLQNMSPTCCFHKNVPKQLKLQRTSVSLQHTEIKIWTTHPTHKLRDFLNRQFVNSAVNDLMIPH